MPCAILPDWLLPKPSTHKYAPRPMPTSLEIAQAARLRPIAEIAAELGVLPDELEPYGTHVAKLKLSLLDRLGARPGGKLVVVTGITPTPLGEGKTTTTIGLVDGLRRLGVRAA